MAAFLGSQTSVKGGEYVDLRSKTSEEPFAYLSRFVPSGNCPKENPLMCGWNEGGKNLSTPQIRLGNGLCRRRGAPRPESQLVGPGVFQYGNGDMTFAQTGTTLRNGKRQVMRGKDKPFGELQTYARYQQGQAPWVQFQSTADRARNKYAHAIACTHTLISHPGPCATTIPTEPFRLGGISTRDAKDFSC